MEGRTQFKICHKGHDLCLHRLEPQSPLWIPTKAVLSLVLCLKCSIYIYYCSCLLPPLNLEFSLDYGYDCQSFKSENQDTFSDRKCVYPNMLAQNSVFVSKWPFSESLKLVRILMYIWVLHWHSWWYMAMEELEGIFKVRIALGCSLGEGKELLGHYG